MRPPVVSLPHVSLLVDGIAWTDRALESIDRIVVQQYLSSPARCEITVAERPGGDGPADSLRHGDRLGVRLGPDGHLFEGTVHAIEHAYRGGARTTRVRAYDALQQLRTRQPVRAFDHVDQIAIAREVTGDLGIEVTGPSHLPSWTRYIQYRDDDLTLLRRLASQSGLHLLFDGRVLRYVDADGSGETERLTLGENLLEVDFEQNDLDAPVTVNVLGWNPARGVFSEASVDDSHAPLRAGTPSAVRTLANEVADDAAHLAARGRAVLDAGRGRSLVVTARALGHTGLRPGVRVDIRGVASDLEGEFLVSSARHSIDRRHGYETTIATGLSGESMPPPSTAVAPGIVSAIDDPEQLGRVRVTLPTFGGLESDWLRVLAVAAGAGKGVIAMPDVSDEVLVLVDSGNPAAGVVLGSVYGAGACPDTGIEGGVVARYTLLTPGGQRVELDDAKGRTRVTNAGGSYIDLSPSQVVLHAAADLRITAPGRAIVIEGQTIDFARV